LIAGVPTAARRKTNPHPAHSFFWLFPHYNACTGKAQIIKRDRFRKIRRIKDRPFDPSRAVSARFALKKSAPPCAIARPSGHFFENQILPGFYAALIFRQPGKNYRHV
jgi:hypothetical protein